MSILGTKISTTGATITVIGTTTTVTITTVGTVIVTATPTILDTTAITIITRDVDMGGMICAHYWAQPWSSTKFFTTAELTGE